MDDRDYLVAGEESRAGDARPVSTGPAPPGRENDGTALEQAYRGRET